MRTGINNWAPIHYASLYSFIEVIAWLTENGANINARDKLHQTPMHAAARSIAMKEQ